MSRSQYEMIPRKVAVFREESRDLGYHRPVSIESITLCICMRRYSSRYCTLEPKSHHSLPVCQRRQSSCLLLPLVLFLDLWLILKVRHVNYHVLQYSYLIPFLFSFGLAVLKNLFINGMRLCKLNRDMATAYIWGNINITWFFLEDFEMVCVRPVN